MFYLNTEEYTADQSLPHRALLTKASFHLFQPKFTIFVRGLELLPFRLNARILPVSFSNLMTSFLFNRIIKNELGSQICKKAIKNIKGGGEECYERLEDFLEFMNQWSFWVRGLVIFVVGLFGLAGNVLTIIVLRQKSQVKLQRR